MTGTDYDERVVALYDDDNPDGPDHDFFRALADDLGAAQVVDLGCGTGILTVTLARDGREVVGVDPSAAMLRYARCRPDADAVRWVLGDSRAIAPARADLALMTGNVAMHVLGDDWPRTLVDLHEALVPGGTLAFESRDPAARAWEGWAGPPSTRDTPSGRVTEWMDVAPPDDDGVVTYRAHTVMEDSGEHVVESRGLAFRSLDRLVADLRGGGLVVQEAFGGWAGGPVTDDGELFVVVARRP